MEKVITIPEAMTMCDNDQEFMNEIVALMREDIAECSNLLANAYSTNDPHAMREVAHRVKGQAANMAAKDLLDKSRRVEDASKGRCLTKTEYLQLMSTIQEFLRCTTNNGA